MPAGSPGGHPYSGPVLPGELCLPLCQAFEEPLGHHRVKIDGDPLCTDAQLHAAKPAADLRDLGKRIGLRASEGRGIRKPIPRQHHNAPIPPLQQHDDPDGDHQQLQKPDPDRCLGRKHDDPGNATPNHGKDTQYNVGRGLAQIPPLFSLRQSRPNRQPPIAFFPAFFHLNLPIKPPAVRMNCRGDLKISVLRLHGGDMMFSLKTPQYIVFLWRF